MYHFQSKAPFCGIECRPMSSARPQAALGNEVESKLFADNTRDLHYRIPIPGSDLLAE